MAGYPTLHDRDHIKMRDYMDRRVTLPKQVTSPTWGPPPPCKQALTVILPSITHSDHVYSSRQVGKKECTKVRSTEFISKQQCQFFVLTPMSLQLKFSVHPCLPLNQTVA